MAAEAGDTAQAAASKAARAAARLMVPAAKKLTAFLEVIQYPLFFNGQTTQG
jgi:hypothetical protein